MIIFTPCSSGTTLFSPFLLNIIIAFIISIFIFFGADFIVEKFLLNNTNLVNALYIGIFILITTTFSTLMQNILIGLEEFRKLATLSIITSSITIPMIFILIYFFFNDCNILC